MDTEREFVLACKLCKYRRSVGSDEVGVVAKMVDDDETGVAGGLDVIEEKLHHMNMFAEHMCGHGEFRVLEMPGGEAVGLLEVTRDFEARSYFYRAGRRK